MHRPCQKYQTLKTLAVYPRSTRNIYGALEIREVGDTDVPFSVIASAARQSMNPWIAALRSQ